MSAATETSEVAILSRVIRPESGTWSRDAATSILEFDFAPADVGRMNALAAKARQGALSAAEKDELENYRDVGRLLELLQSKARLSLAASRANGPPEPSPGLRPQADALGFVAEADPAP